MINIIEYIKYFKYFLFSKKINDKPIPKIKNLIKGRLDFNDSLGKGENKDDIMHKI